MDLIEQLNSIARQAAENFSSLSFEQLNWKPHPSKWSIAQCLDHLIISSSAYLPTFDKLLNGTYQLPLMQRLNPLNKTFGPLMVKFLGPQSKRKLRNPKILTPSASSLSVTIADDFLKQQNVLKDYFRKLEQLNTYKIVITSPVTPFVSYSLNHAMQIIAVHQQRHVNQALNVLNHPNFPKRYEPSFV